MKSPHQTIVELRFLELGLVPPALDLKKALESMDLDESLESFIENLRLREWKSLPSVRLSEGIVVTTMGGELGVVHRESKELR